MNFKRNFLVITVALVGALTVTSCGSNGNFEHYEFIEEVDDKHEGISGEGFVRPGKYSSYKVLDASETEVSLGSSYDVFKNYGGASHIPSEGEQKIIVIPVQFTDYKTEKLNLTEEGYIEAIKKAFFGNTKNNAYVSVGEYFNRSSYGKLKLDGKVCDKVYTFEKSVKDIKEAKLKQEDLASYYDKVIKWYNKNYTDINDYVVSGLKTGKNVPIYMVYTYPSDANNESDPEKFFWAYTFSDIPMSWSSASFMYLQYGQPDAHTYIHETGHLLGLTDYYPTNIETKKIDKETSEIDEPVIPEPAGRIDMMDCSVGDETSFSKMFLNWSRPINIMDSCEISLSSFTETGDVALVGNNWNGTIFDDYYLFEYYTPTGLNAYDVSVGNSQARLPKVPGIKIYHVDARLGYFTNAKPKVFFEYCQKTNVNPANYIVGFAHDNNTYTSPKDENEEHYLYTLVQNHQSGVKGECATDASLFRVGDKIPELKFADGTSIGYNIELKSASFSQITINFQKAK